jgi:hypothetical protein
MRPVIRAHQNRSRTPHYDLTVRHARARWTQIRWSLFVFPDIIDVAPTDDPEVLRIFYEGKRAYPAVWRVELLQAGFDVPPLDRCRSGGPAVAAALSRAPTTAARRGGRLAVVSTPSPASAAAPLAKDG